MSVTKNVTKNDHFDRGPEFVTSHPWCFMVPYWFFMVKGWFFMVPGGFLGFFMVPGWFFIVVHGFRWVFYGFS